MRPDDFEMQWKRLENKFGFKAMNYELKILCSAEVINCDASDFREMVNHWVGDLPHTKPPLLTEFRWAKTVMQKKQQDRMPQPETPIDRKCGRCGDVGSVQAIRKGDKGRGSSTYSFLCPSNCEASNKLSYQIPRWGSKFEKEFRMLNKNEDPLSAWLQEFPPPPKDPDVLEF